MIPLTRIRMENAIHHNFYGETKKRLEQELLLEERRVKRGKAKKHNFKSSCWKSAKEQLFAETGGKCAYCEDSILAGAYGDVEHYRPKSIYWWLAYCYDNYLAACEICNQRFKRDNFPIQNERMLGPAIHANTTDEIIASQTGAIAPNPLNEDEVNDFIHLHQEERPLLINPYFDDPAEYFAWCADEDVKEVEITANSERSQVEIVVNTENPDVESIAAASIQYYGLNRKKLKDDRYFIYNIYNGYRQILEYDNIPLEVQRVSKNAIEGMKSPGAPFAGMIRYFDALSPIPEN